MERHRAGETLKAIAESLPLDRYTVRHWWRAFRDGDRSNLEPTAKSPPRVGPPGRFDPLVKYVALRLKRAHPAWGFDMLRLHMGRRPSLQGLRLPKNTALWSYLHQFGPRLVTPRRLPTKRPGCPPVRAKIPHQCWELGFKGDAVVAGCHCVISPLAVSDEASGAPLARRIHVLQAKLPSRHQGCQGQPPAVTYPDLMKPRRPYRPEQERALFDLGRVDAYLAQWEWRRQVDEAGKIALSDRNHRVGKRYHGQVVKVRFAPSTREFVCFSVAEEEIARLQLVEVALDYILGEGI